jgi:hypothetical protein
VPKNHQNKKRKTRSIMCYSKVPKKFFKELTFVRLLSKVWKIMELFLRAEWRKTVKKFCKKQKKANFQI